ncbi:hypothetical protein FOHLNKBM_0232 [Methylobacterium longum]|jgi:hypothetical protein|nr:hypothetical protein FOHLNKBM_0232 [Methylobacterium longum]
MPALDRSGIVPGFPVPPLLVTPMTSDRVHAGRGSWGGCRTGSAGWPPAATFLAAGLVARRLPRDVGP